MRVVRLLLIGYFVAASGCAGWGAARPIPVRSCRHAGAPVRPGSQPFPPSQPLPILPDPAAFAWPRVQLGQAVPTPPATALPRTPAIVPATVPTATVAVGTTNDARWRSEYESTQRRPIQTALLGSGAEHVLVTASLAGNDPAAVQLLDALLDRLSNRPTLLDGRQAVLVRDPHPDGLAEHITVNARGVDLNRNFPSPRFTASPTRETGPHPASEAETRVLLRLFGEAKPGRVIHVRSGKSDRPLVTGNAACLELLDQLRSEFAVDIATFDGEFKAGSLEEFAATRLKAQIIVVELPATPAGQSTLVDLLTAATVETRRAIDKQQPPGDDPPVASQPATSPAALTGSVESSGPDGEKGYVEILPPPPDSATDHSAITESRYYELPPP